MGSELSPHRPPRSQLEFRAVAFVVFCVGLPVAALVFELLTHGSLLIHFDPIPTWLHVALVASVPVIIVIADRAVRLRRASPAVCASTGFATAVSLVYTLLYLPLLPISAIAVVAYGLGLLPFAPLAGLIGAFRVGRLSIGGIPRGRRVFGCGFAFAVAILATAELQGWMVIRGLESESVETLEFWASRNSLLRAAHYGTNHLNLTSHLRSGFQPFGADPEREADSSRNRVIFYRMTGEDVAALPLPGLPGTDEPTLFGEVRRRERNEARGLSLGSSRVDTVVFGDQGFAYLEWTLAFRNDASFPQEARARLQLPAGGAVTRANLWIGGEEREAAFGPRAQVREAYEAVVETRRDPLLVTSDRPGEADVRAFPIPPRGEPMRIRIGVTFPLQLDAPNQAGFSLPVITERNFAVDDDLGHGVWLDSRTPILSVPEPLETSRADGVATARGSIPLDAPNRSVVVSRSGDARETWTIDSTRDAASFLRQRIAPAPASTDRWLVVVDGSLGAAAYRVAIADALAAFDPSRLAGLVVALDEPTWLLGEDRSDSGKAVAQLRETEFRGGRDNLLSLEAAWDRALLDGVSVLWICGGQPLALRPPDTLLQRLERRPDVKILAVPLGAARNVLLDALPHPAVKVVRVADLRKDLGALGNIRSSSWQFVRDRLAKVPDGAEVLHADHEATRHLARLWASDEVERQISGSPAEKVAAAELATRYRVVTPVSGAVVLEMVSQYEAAGLSVPDPLDFDSLPSIPEPGTAALLGVGMALMAARRRRS